MKNNRADGSKSRINPAKNHTKKQENLFSFPPIKKMEKKKWIGKNEIMDFTLWAKKKQLSKVKK